MKRPPEGPRGGDTFGGIFPSAMETNDLGFVASLLFVLVPAVFLIILYIQTNSRQGG
jgi:photosystem II PsbM protein